LASEDNYTPVEKLFEHNIRALNCFFDSGFKVQLAFEVKAGKNERAAVERTSGC